jgi:hypothetical protein
MPPTPLTKTTIENIVSMAGLKFPLFEYEEVPDTLNCSSDQEDQKKDHEDDIFEPQPIKMKSNDTKAVASAFQNTIP